MSISLSNDGDIVISWSPKLHMLVHHELLEMYHILRRPATVPPKHSNFLAESEEYAQPSMTQTLPDTTRQGIAIH